MSTLISTHFSKGAADVAATELLINAAKLAQSGRHSSGWARRDYKVKRHGRIKRWKVVEL